MLPLEMRFRNNADIYVISEQISSEMVDGVGFRDGCGVENVQYWWYETTGTA